MSTENVTNSEDKSTVGFEVAFPIICATVSILALVVLKKYLKNLNEVIKNILLALSLHNLASSIVASGIILFWNGKNTILERCNTPRLNRFKCDHYSPNFGIDLIHQVLLGLEDI